MSEKVTQNQTTVSHPKPIGKSGCTSISLVSQQG